MWFVNIYDWCLLSLSTMNAHFCCMCTSFIFPGKQEVEVGIPHSLFFSLPLFLISFPSDILTLFFQSVYVPSVRLGAIQADLIQQGILSML